MECIGGGDEARDEKKETRRSGKLQQVGGKDGLPPEVQQSQLFGEDTKSQGTESGLGERDEGEEVMMSQRQRREPVEWLVLHLVKGKSSPSGTAAELAVGETRSQDENEEDR